MSTILKRPKIVGYAKAHKRDRHISAQAEILQGAGCEIIYRDDEGMMVSMDHRPGLKKCLRSLNPGDLLIVAGLDRFARSIRDLIRLLKILDQEGVALRAIHDGIDTSGSQGPIIKQLLSAFSEMERALINERTAQGKKAAKLRGVKFGRKLKLNDFQCRKIAELVAAGQTVKDVSRSWNLGLNTVYRALKRAMDLETNETQPRKESQ